MKGVWYLFQGQWWSFGKVLRREITGMTFLQKFILKHMKRWPTSLVIRKMQSKT